MRRQCALLAVAMLIVAACGDDAGTGTSETAAPTAGPATTAPPATTTTPQTPTSEAPGTTAQQPAMAEAHPLVIVAIDFEAGFILIRNDGDADYDLTGHWLCNRPTYQALPGETLAPGRIIEIDAASMNITASDGELGVYTSNDFGSATDIVRYVEWGAADHGRSGTAIAAGIWVEGDFVDNNGANIESTGSNPMSSADWTP